MMNTLQPYFITERLLLRPWETADAERLFSIACDPDIGPSAGWLPHTSVEYSRGVISASLMRPGEYAIVPRSVRHVIGSIDLKFGSDGNVCLDKGEAEIGYWIGRDHWGNGYVPEAVNALVEYGFGVLGLGTIWCLCRVDNRNSRRVQEKCGFRFVRDGMIDDPIFGPLNMRFTCITRQDWQNGLLCSR